MKNVVVVCALMALAGCAAVPQEDQASAPMQVAAAGNTAGQDGHQMTGSRLKDRTSTDRMLKAVGAQGARDEMNNAPRPLQTN